MSYSIIFETKIVKLPDGKIIHFSRQGCNNDNCGRKKDEFRAELYSSEQDFIKFAENFRGDEPKLGFELKIGSKYTSYNDYYKHLIRMLKRGKTLEQFTEAFKIKGRYCDTIEVYSPERVTLSADEFGKRFYKYLRNGLSYRRNDIILHSAEMDKIIDRLAKQQPIEFEIVKR